jgi:uncharacterized protein (TIGR02217 family)
MAFHEVRFPTDISRGGRGGPERRTDIVTLGSGYEERNSRWADSRRSYNAGYGIKSLEQLHAVIAFFEERRGRLHGFRWRDHADWKSCSPDRIPSAADQLLGTGDGHTAIHQLIKTYGSAFAPWQRQIKKPVAGSVRIAVAGVERDPAADFIVDPSSGLVTFAAAPAAGASITAGFEFDVPVRFDADKLEIDVQSFRHGAMPAIPIAEIRL